MRAASGWRKTAWLVVGAAGVALGPTGCDLTQSERATDELQEHYALWQERRPDAYEFVLHQGCVCPPEQERPTWIRVQGEEAVEARDVETGDPVSLSDPRVLSIDEVFLVMIEHMRKPLASGNMSFAVDLHHPTSFHGWLPDFVATEFRFQIDGFIPRS